VNALLRWLSRQRPWKVFATVLMISLITSPLCASAAHPVLLTMSAVFGATVRFGYPILVIFGFPARYSTPLRRRIALCSGMLLCVLASAAALAPSPHPQMPDWLRVTFGLPLTALLFAPFFIATGVIGDARRAVGQYLIGDCISTWLCVFTYPLFGVFFVQRRVAAALAALDATPPTAHGRAVTA
jgi:hypothetical protein